MCNILHSGGINLFIGMSTTGATIIEASMSEMEKYHYEQ